MSTLLSSITSLKEALLPASSITLLCHVNPDGDTIGTALALRLGLISLGKTCVVACEDTFPPVYSMLVGWGMERKEVGESELFLAVDCADQERLGSLRNVFASHPNAWQLDHHATNTGFAPGVAQSAAATAELALSLLDALGANVSPDVAACLFCGISTDTGNFMYGNTTASCMRAAARCVELGVPVAEMTDRFFRSRPLRKTKLLGQMLSHMEMIAESRIAVSILREEDFAAAGASAEDTENLIQEMMQSDGVIVAALLRPAQPNQFKVSLRSRSSFDVIPIVAAFHGGGHKNAAGCTVCEKDIPVLIECIAAAVRNEGNQI